MLLHHQLLIHFDDLRNKNTDYLMLHDLDTRNNLKKEKTYSTFCQNNNFLSELITKQAFYSTSL